MLVLDCFPVIKSELYLLNLDDILGKVHKQNRENHIGSHWRQGLHKNTERKTRLMLISYLI